MTQQSTGPAVFNPDGSHTHTIPASVTPTPAPAPAPAPAPVGTLPVLPALIAIGTGTQATAWANAILAALGASQNSACVASLIAWFAAEDDNQPWGHEADGAGQNNPLNVTEDSGTFAGVTGSEPSGAGPGHPGNLDFDTPAHGVAATAQVIQGYPAIHGALMSGAGLIGNPAVSANLSTWSDGGYSSLS